MINTLMQKMFLVTAPGALVDNTSPATASIDMLGFDYADIYVVLGATDIAMAALKLQESDDDSTYIDVTGANFATAPATLPSATADNTLVAWHVNMLGRKRYLDVVATGGDGAAGAYIMIFAILSRAEQSPNSVSGRGLGQELFV